MFEKHSELGQEVELFTYDYVQKLLASRRTDEKIPIAIVDLSQLSPKPIPGAQKGEMATPREGVEEPLEKLVNTKPLAIGVDVDFSPRVYLDSSPPRTVFITPRDPEFFEYCLELSHRRGVPIYLGISRTQALPHSEWLGRSDYAGQGAR